MKSSWIAYRVPKSSARVRLFCFPYAGRGASTFRAWARAAPDSLDVCPIQLPGREGRLNERPFSELRPLLDALVDDLMPHLDHPFALFGCSMGATIAFELARTLGERGIARPLHLFVAARRAPGRPPSHPPVHHLPDEDFLRHLRTYAGTPVEILRDRDAMSVYLPSIRADFAVCERHVHRPGRPLECPVTVVGGQADPHVTLEDLAAWRDVTASSFSLETFDAGHFLLESRGDELLRLVARHLHCGDESSRQLNVA